MDTRSNGTGLQQETGNSPTTKEETVRGEGQTEMSMRVEDYLKFSAEYRSKSRSPPPEFNGLPQEIIPLIIAVGTSGN